MPAKLANFWATSHFTTLLLLPIPTVGVSATASEYRLGISIQRAFLLSDSPDSRKGDQLVHSLVGYLPTGTIVYFSGPRRKLYNHNDEVHEYYYRVDTDIGYSGLLREDLFIEVYDQAIAIPVAPRKIWLYHPTLPNNPDAPARKMLQFSRTDGVYLEIVSISDPEYYDVILHRAEPGAFLPSTEKGRLKKVNVRSAALKLVKPINPSEVKNFDQIIPKWSEKENIEQRYIQKIAEVLKEKVPEVAIDLRSFFSDLNRLQCILHASGQADIGFKIFGTGLGFTMGMNVKETDHMYSFEKYDLIKGNNASTQTIFRNVKCDGLLPERLVQLTLQEGVYNPKKRVYVRLKDLQLAKSPWITTLQGSKVPMRMIRITGWAEYISIFRHLMALSTAGESYLSEIAHNERDLLINFIIKQISYFEHPTTVTPPETERGRG